MKYKSLCVKMISEVMNMAKYNENIYDDSIWITATPTLASLSLPFMATESGHFIAYEGYSVSREFHDSFLLIYTVKGTGVITSNGSEAAIPAGNGIVIDCRTPHAYKTASDEWDFYWVHIKGSGTEPISALSAPYGLRASEVADNATFERLIKRVMQSMRINDVASSIQISSDLHRLFLVLARSVIEAENFGQKREYAKEIDIVTDYIKDNYQSSITIDDMLSSIHLSKYHFIRIFKRIMGTTPYSYLTNYRINMAKRMLRLTDKSIAEIASDCGFMDTSNFITHFKKSTGVKPVQYRRDFT